MCACAKGERDDFEEIECEQLRERSDRILAQRRGYVIAVHFRSEAEVMNPVRVQRATSQSPGSLYLSILVIGISPDSTGFAN